MATRRQELAVTAELLVVDRCRCLRCGGAFLPLRRSSPDAAVRCVACGGRAQVRARRWAAVDGLPRKVMGAAWAPQAGLLLQDRLCDLFLVLVGRRFEDSAAYALPACAQDHRLFRRRCAPTTGAEAAFTYELEAFWASMTRIGPGSALSEERRVVCALRRPVHASRRELRSVASGSAALLPLAPFAGATVVPFRR